MTFGSKNKHLLRNTCKIVCLKLCLGIKVTSQRKYSINFKITFMSRSVNFDYIWFTASNNCQNMFNFTTQNNHNLMFEPSNDDSPVYDSLMTNEWNINYDNFKYDKIFLMFIYSQNAVNLAANNISYPHTVIISKFDII